MFNHSTVTVTFFPVKDSLVVEKLGVGRILLGAQMGLPRRDGASARDPHATLRAEVHLLEVRRLSRSVHVSSLQDPHSRRLRYTAGHDARWASRFCNKDSTMMQQQRASPRLTVIAPVFAFCSYWET